MAPPCCRHDAADRDAEAASDGFALVETEVYWESVATVRTEEDFVGTTVHRVDDQVRSDFHTIERQSVRGPSGTFHK